MTIALFVDSRFRFTKGLVFKFGKFDVTSGSRGMFLIFLFSNTLFPIFVIF